MGTRWPLRPFAHGATHPSRTYRSRARPRRKAQAGPRTANYPGPRCITPVLSSSTDLDVALLGQDLLQYFYQLGIVYLLGEPARLCQSDQLCLNVGHELRLRHPYGVQPFTGLRREDLAHHGRLLLLVLLALLLLGIGIALCPLDLFHLSPAYFIQFVAAHPDHSVKYGSPV